MSSPYSVDRRALLADRLALARIERREEIVERAVAVVVPVILHAQAREEPDLLKQVAFRAAREGDVQRGHAGILDRRDQGGDQGRPRLALLPPGADQQARPGDRREGRGDLQLRIIAAAGAVIGLGPAVVEHIFALAVGFDVERRGGEDGPGAILDHQVLRQPAGLAPDRSGLLQRVQKGVADKRVFRPSIAFAGGAGIPRGGGNLGDAIDDARGQG